MLKHLLLFSLRMGIFFLLPVASVAQIGLDTLLPVDPHVLVGHLDNGLTYYIRNNTHPAKKVELRLVVNVGSILEDDHQQGLAHFSEHMAFKGTTHFHKNDLINFLQSIGVQFGADLNASTSFDETIYILPIPTDKPGNLDSGFQIIEDWAHNVSYTTQDINEERPVILEESRLGKGAGQRMRDKYFPDLVSGSKYAHRIPIGLDSIIKSFSPDTLRQFYHTWYRPDLMAVIVVGDVDKAKVEAMIKKHFAGIANPSPEVPRTYAPVPERTVSEGLVVTDKEATRYILQLFYSFEKKPVISTLGDFRTDVLKDLFRIMLNQRLSELTQKDNPPFLNAEAGFSDGLRGYEGFAGSASVGKDGVQPALSALVEEIERVKQFGFTNGELERAKKSLLNEAEQAFQERDKTESGDFVGDYIQHFLDKEPIPGVENEYRYYQELLPGISTADVSALTGLLKQNDNHLVLLLGPEKGNFPVPTGDSLLAEVDEASKMTLTPYVEKTVATDLIKNKPQPGTITQETKDTALGTTTLTFNNGIEVTLKPTDFKNDEILLNGFRKGGTSQYGVADKANADHAAAIITQMGIGDFSPTDLAKANAGKTVSVTPQLGDLSADISGSSSVKDLETMLEMVNLYCTSPRKDTSLFNTYRSRQITSVQFIMANPQAAFLDTMAKVLYQGNPLAPAFVPHVADFKAIDLDRTLQIFKDQFGNAAGLRFTLVGSFDVEKIKPLLAEYLGSLPAAGKSYSFVDNGVRPLASGTTLTVHKGKDKKGLVLKFYNVEAPYSEASDMALDGLSEVLNIRIIQRLRQKIGGIYSGGTFAQASRYPYNNFSLILQLPCDPDKVDTLLKAFSEELEKIKKDGPTSEEMEKIKAQWKEKFATDSKENSYWIQVLHSVYLLDAEQDWILNYLKHADALTADQIRQVASKVAKENKSFTAVLLPE